MAMPASATARRSSGHRTVGHIERLVSTPQLSTVDPVRWDIGAVSPNLRYRREGPGLEFDRVTFFTDAVFAIAMTLLVVEVGVPESIDGASGDAGALLETLRDKVPLLAAFFLGCFIIGAYWTAHHRFMAQLKAVDLRFVFLTVVYLTFIALLPFPIGLIGEFPENPISVVALAITAAAVSTMEAVLFRHAWRNKLLRDDVPRDAFRWMLAMSLSPVALFLLSLPVAFVATWLAVLVWGLSIPVQTVLDRRRPASVDLYLDPHRESGR
jgi:uncharacterized membrane protein